jgi:hypothetical protein
LKGERLGGGDLAGHVGQAKLRGLIVGEGAVKEHLLCGVVEQVGQAGLGLARVTCRRRE